MKIERKAQRAFDRKILKLARKAQPAEKLPSLSSLPLIVRVPLSLFVCSFLWIVSSFLAQAGLWLVGYHRKSRIWEWSNAVSQSGLDALQWGRTGRKKAESVNYTETERGLPCNKPA
jgi:hypothetical protein